MASFLAMNLSMALRVVSLCLLVSLAFPSFAVTIGELQAGTGSTIGGSLNPGFSLTFINKQRPALAAGTINIARLLWSDATCTGASIKVKTVRYNNEAGAMYVVAERGPFTPSAGSNRFTLTPPIAIIKGDFIAVTQFGGPDCSGGLLSSPAEFSDYSTYAFGDPALGTKIMSPIVVAGRLPNIAGGTTEDLLHGYVIVAGSLRGEFGSQFKTGLQLSNSGTIPIKGKLVFHPAGVPSSPSDPVLPYDLAPRKTISFDDVIQAFGRSGLGTLDLVNVSGHTPNVTVRIFNDQGDEGTSGLTEELVTPYRALLADQGGTLTIPADLTNFRLNIGYRTLEAGAQLQVQVYDKDGVLVPGTEAQSFAASTFQQLSGVQFAGRSALPAGGLIRFQVTSGSIFVYGAVTDNRTNDGNLTFATRE